MKAYVVTFSDAAEADLFAIYDYIAERAGSTVAFDYISGFATAPERGLRRNDLGGGLRTVAFERSATVLFHVDSNQRQVTILGVYYRGRNLPAE